MQSGANRSWPRIRANTKGRADDKPKIRKPRRLRAEMLPEFHVLLPTTRLFLLCRGTGGVSPYPRVARAPKQAQSGMDASSRSGRSPCAEPRRQICCHPEELSLDSPAEAQRISQHIGAQSDFNMLEIHHEDPRKIIPCSSNAGLHSRQKIEQIKSGLVCVPAAMARS
jgi:hypothetical protein